MPKLLRLFVFGLVFVFISNVIAGGLTDEEFEAEKKKAVKLAEELVPVAEQLRGKKFKFHIEKGVYTRDMIADYMIGSFEEEEQAEIDKYTGILWKMGLTDKDFDLAKIFKKMYVDNIGGFYDPRIEELNIVKMSASPTMFEKIAMVHELTHAIDDQHYDLLNGVDMENMTTDEQLAYKSVIEGTTGCVQWDYTVKRPSYDFEQLKKLVIKMPGKMELSQMGKGIPAILARQLYWSYSIGLKLAFEARVRANGSFELIDKMFEDIPASTEQVLHPEKYFDNRDNPVMIKFEDDFEKSWGDGWELIDDDSFGEFQIWAYLLEVLDGYENIETLAPKAAEGWDGDRTFFVNNEELDNVSFVWRLEFDTVEDVKEFVAVYEKVLEKKYKGKEEPGFVTGIETKEKAVLIFESLPIGKAEEIKEKAWNAKLEEWKKPVKGTNLRYSEKYTPPTKEVECENWNGKEYKEDWISMTLPRDGFKVIYDKDFTMFMAPEKETSEFVLTRMHRFNRDKLNKVGKEILRNRINKGLTDIKLLEESESEEDGYRWFYVIVGKDKKGVQRVSMTVVFEDSARKKLFQITVHGKFENMPIIASDFNKLLVGFKTEPRKAKKELQPQE